MIQISYYCKLCIAGDELQVTSWYFLMCIEDENDVMKDVYYSGFEEAGAC